MKLENSDSLRDVYDVSGGARGKHYEAYRARTNIALLEPDVAKVFKDSAAVNKALCAILQIASEGTTKNRTVKKSR